MKDKQWNEIFSSNEFKEFYKKVEKEYKEKTIYPDEDKIFNAFNTTKFEEVKVVIIGQDPYHGEGEAMGLSFSVNDGIKIPPSLRNIYKELNSDLSLERKNGDLTSWAKQGVLLLNSVLTVEKDAASSHKKLGWEKYTDKVIEVLNKKESPVVFVLWGNFARDKKKLITNNQHLILESVHPSPLSASRGFFGTKPFSKINNFLKSKNMQEIEWE